MNSHLDDVNELLKRGVGDRFRLEHLKKTLEANRVLYISDRKYLEELVKEHLTDFEGKKLPKFNKYDYPEYENKVKGSTHSESEPKPVEKEIHKPKSENTTESKLSSSADPLFCWKCGKSNEGSSKFCNNCGSPVKKIETKSDEVIHEKMIEERPKKTKKKRSWKKKIGIGIGVIIVLFFGLAILSSIASETSEIELKNPDLSPQEIQRQAITGITYDQLMRDNEEYVDKILLLNGEVVQAQNVYGDKYVLRISITKENLGFGAIYYSDPVWVNYAGKRILEGDKVQFYGHVQGIKEYTAVFGQTIEIPELNALILEVGSITIEELEETQSTNNSNSKCGPGTVFDDTTNSCVLEGTTSSNSKCGPGTVFDEKTNSCIVP